MNLLSKNIIGTLFIVFPLIISTLILSKVLTTEASQSADETVSPSVLITEFFPNPVGADSGKEWVELYNPTDFEISLEGFEIQTESSSGNVRNFTLPNINIEPNRYRVISEDPALEIAEEARILIVNDGDLNFYNSGVKIRLLSESTELLDELSYTSISEGNSLQRVGIKISEECLTLQESTSPNPGNNNQSFIDECMPTDEVTEPDELEIKIFFSVDNVNFFDGLELWGRKEVYFKYDITNSDVNILDEKWLINDSEVTERFTEIMPNDEIVVGLELLTENETLKTSSSGLKVNSTALQISEAFPAPDSSKNEEEWIEIYNFGDYEINLKSWTLQDESSEVEVLEQKAIQPKEYLVISDLDFALNNASDSLKLSSPDGEERDLFSYESSDKSKSFSRKLEGKILGEEIFLTDPTPGQNNIIIEGDEEDQIENVIEDEDTNTNYSKTLKITEIHSAPESGEKEWLEIYNTGEESIELNGYYFLNQTDSKKSIGDLEILPKEYLVIDEKYIPSLNNSGGKITIYTPNDEIIDTVEFPKLERGFSFSSTKNNSFVVTFPSKERSQSSFETLEPISVSELVIAKDNEVYVTKGVITAEYQTLFDDSFLLQDISGAARIFTELEADIDSASGIELIVHKYNNELLLLNESDIKTENLNIEESDLVVEIEESSDLEKLNYGLVSVSGEIIKNNSASFDIEKFENVFRISQNKELVSNLPTQSKGDLASIKGILINEDSFSRIYPLTLSDIKISEETEDLVESADEERDSSIESFSQSQAATSNVLGASKLDLPIYFLDESDSITNVEVEEDSYKLHFWPVPLAGLLLLGSFVYSKREDPDFVKP